MKRSLAVPLTIAAAFVLLAGCHDATAPRDTTPPAAPRGLHSITGDQAVYLQWLANTEADVVGYRVYESTCGWGPDCPFDRVGATSGTELVVHGLANGRTRYFAVSAVDEAGNESALSRDNVFDTPRPEGFGVALSNYLETPATSGWDFAAQAIRPYDDLGTDVYFGMSNGLGLMLTSPSGDTGIQDAGYGATLDAVDYSPTAGWSPTGSAELVIGHCYIVHTHDDHYAKFRVTALTTHGVQMDWAYQVDAGNRELHAKPAAARLPGARRAVRRS